MELLEDESDHRPRIADSLGLQRRYVVTGEDIRPDVARSNGRACNSVLLPEPDGPTIFELAGIDARSTLRSASTRRRLHVTTNSTTLTARPPLSPSAIHRL
jgi:hypothetical protein